MAKIITVISGKGGSGKTTVAVNISAGFKLIGKRSLLIDCSFGVRNDDIPLNCTSSLLYNIGDILSGEAEFEDALIEGSESYMPDFIAASVNEIPQHFNTQLARMLKKISHHYDFIVFDTPAAVGCEQRECCSLADIILAVSAEDTLSLQNTSLCIRRMTAVSNKEIYLILNRADFSAANSGLSCEEIADESGAKLIGIIREDEFVAQSLIKGDPIIRYDTYAGRELENICRRLCNEYISPAKQTLSERLFDKNRLVLKT